MSYTVSPYLVSIDDLKHAVGSQDRKVTLAVLNKRAEERNETFDENELDNPVPKDEDNDWNTTAAVKALVDGDLKNEKIAGFQYGYALEALCAYLGKREGVESLESVRSGCGSFDDYWDWIFGDETLIPFKGYNSSFPTIGYLRLADIPKEIKRTKKLKFDTATQNEGSAEAQEMLAAMLAPQKARLELELAVFSAKYEVATVSPADFPWLDESYYDSVQQELESLGFSKVRDVEYHHLSRICQETRHFSRLLVNAERNICASISQVRFIDPKTGKERRANDRIVRFTSEFSDGAFFITENTKAIQFFAVENVTYVPSMPKTPLKKLLDEHKSPPFIQPSPWTKEVRIHATDDDLIAMGERLHHLMRVNVPKKLQEFETENAVKEEPDTELLDWLESIRTDLLALYAKAVETKKDIVTFYY